MFWIQQNYEFFIRKFLRYKSNIFAYDLLNLHVNCLRYYIDLICIFIKCKICHTHTRTHTHIIIIII